MDFLSQFRHKITGPLTAPKLVFLHGLMGYGANWGRIVPAFEAQYQILSFDQRGHGHSIKPEHGYAPENYADDLKAILDELKWTKINLVGHSMGGRNAMNFAHRFPQMVEKLVIEDIGPDVNQKAIDHIHGIINKVPVPFSDKRLAKEFFLNEFGDSVLGAYLYSNLDQGADGLWNWRFSRSAILESVDLGRKHERWNEIEELKMPTLIIRGEKSDELSREVFEKMLKANKVIKGIEIMGAGHWVHSDKPKEFISTLKSFLEA